MIINDFELIGLKPGKSTVDFETSIVLSEVKGPLGTAISIAYCNHWQKWWWVGVWSANRSAASRIAGKRGWAREEHPEHCSTLFACVLWNEAEFLRSQAEAGSLVSAQ